MFYEISSPKIISPETINKLKTRSNGVIVKVLDEDNSLVDEFPTITEAAKFYGVERFTIRNYASTGKLWDQKLLFKMEFKLITSNKIEGSKPLSYDMPPTFNSRGNLVEVYDKDNKLLYRFD